MELELDNDRFLHIHSTNLNQTFKYRYTLQCEFQSDRTKIKKIAFHNEFHFLNSLINIPDLIKLAKVCKIEKYMTANF